MQTWTSTYRRLRGDRRFVAWFGHKGRIPGPNDFVYRAFNLAFSGVTGFTGGLEVPANDPDAGPLFGPSIQIFDKGAVILGITSAAYQAQHIPVGGDPPGVAIEPSTTPGRRDTFRLYFQFTDGEKITPDISVMTPTDGVFSNQVASNNADALTGEGQKDIFPCDLLVAPSTGFIVQVKSLQPELFQPDEHNEPLFIHVVFHCVVPRG